MRGLIDTAQSEVLDVRNGHESAYLSGLLAICLLLFDNSTSI